MTLVLILFAVLGAWAGFANPVYQEPLAVFLLPAGLTLLGWHANGAKNAFFKGFSAATIAYVGCLYWIVVPVHIYGGLHRALALPCPVLLSMYLALYAGIYAMGIRLMGQRLSPLLLGLFAGGLWASLESAVGYVFSGFPWLPLSLAFAPRPWAIQLASVVGGFGLGFLAVACTVWLMHPDSKLLSPSRILAVAVLVVWGAFGALEPGMDVRPLDTVSVSVVQGNIDQSLKWDESYQSATMDRYIELSERAAQREHAELIVWPETAMPFYFQELGLPSARVRSLPRNENVTLLAGSPAYTMDFDSQTYTSYNRAYLLGDGGRTLGYYDKEHLVPFGEYVPLGEYLPLGKLVEGVGDFSPGRDQGPLESERMAIGVLICYESIFPALSRKRVENGANLLVNMSNDAWFGKTSAPRQHLHHSVLRSVEQGRWIVRSTNTGISAFIDHRGRIRKTTEMFEAAVLSDRVELMDHRTPYSRFFFFIHGGVYALTIVLLFFGMAGGRRSDPL